MRSLMNIPEPIRWHLNTKLPQDYRVIAVFEAGSRAHGTYVPPTEAGLDDEDYVAIVMPSPRGTYGLTHWEGNQTQWDEGGTRWDLVVYTWPKLIRLLLKGNPNVLGLLWQEPLWYNASLWDAFTLRAIFRTKQPASAFLGYALNQQKRMLAPSHEGYMGEKRKLLFAKHGYDTKNAAHCLRLLFMLTEFLSTGEMHVRRPEQEAAYLIRVKQGGLKLEEIQAAISAAISGARFAEQNSILSISPPTLTAENELMLGLERSWSFPL